MRSLTLTTGERSHPLVIGPLASELDLIDALFGSPGGPIPLVSDERVWRLHGAALADRFDARPLLVPEGEAGKSWDSLGRLLAALAELDPDRSTPILALGGGSVGDVGGLAAALFKRGCPLVQLPTTLLAQADSAIGGKTGIDFAGAKNLVGVLHPPALVIADPALLATLDRRQLRAGFAEVVKYGVIDDPAFFAWCESNGGELLAGRLAPLGEAIEHCARAKARIIGDDLADRSGQRALLNFGHSFAHAIEVCAGLGTVLHGEAVAVGMVLALRFSANLGLCDADEARRLAALLSRAGLPATLEAVGLGGAGPALLAQLDRDKKNGRDGLTLVLARGIGRAFVQRGVDRAPLAAFLAAA